VDDNESWDSELTSDIERTDSFPSSCVEGEDSVVGFGFKEGVNDRELLAT
jgi:hypothetical protein